MTTKEGEVKDGKTNDKEEIKVGKTIEVLSKIEMDDLTKMGITEMKGINKVGIWSVFIVIKKDIKRMIVHCGSNILKMKMKILNLKLVSMLLLWNSVHPLS